MAYTHTHRMLLKKMAKHGPEGLDTRKLDLSSNPPRPLHVTSLAAAQQTPNGLASGKKAI